MSKYTMSEGTKYAKDLREEEFLGQFKSLLKEEQ